VLLSGLQLLTLLLLAVYLGWGVYTLDRRYRRHEEWPPAVEAATLVAVLLFYAIEVSLLRHTMQEEAVVYMFALLGLFVSGAALYGHMAVSLTSRILVEVVSPARVHDPSVPRLGPAEALERQHDFEGAVQEYLVLARIFPKDTTILTRLAENHLKLQEPEAAVGWLERAYQSSSDSDDALLVANRLAEVCKKDLHDTERARKVLQGFLKRFPESSHAASVSVRLEKLEAAPAARGSQKLESLEDLPREQRAAMPVPTLEIPRPKPTLGLDPLAETGVAADADEAPEESAEEAAKPESSLSLEALQDATPPPSSEPKAKDVPTKRRSNGLKLDALDKRPLSDEES